jgi:hypothetical protein
MDGGGDGDAPLMRVSGSRCSSGAGLLSATVDGFLGRRRHFGLNWKTKTTRESGSLSAQNGNPHHDSRA